MKIEDETCIPNPTIVYNLNFVLIITLVGKPFLFRLWKLLGRTGGEGTERETLLPLPNPAIVPGGR